MRICSKKMWLGIGPVEEGGRRGRGAGRSGKRYERYERYEWYETSNVRRDGNGTQVRWGWNSSKTGMELK
jgi:hypothetical protein